MKNVLKVVLGLLVCFTSLTGFSLEFNDIVVTNIKKGHKLVVINETGRVIYKEVATDDGKFENDFNFANLNDGKYTLEINKDTSIEVKKFKVVNNEVTFIDEAEVFKPIIRFTNDRVYISQLAINNNKSMDVAIYYEDEIITSETVKGEQILNRVYHLSEDVSGTYTVVINTNNRKYKHYFYK